MMLLIFALLATTVAGAPYCGPDIPAGFAAINGSYKIGQGQHLDYQLCGALPGACGINPSEKCYMKPNCCGGCQWWPDGDGFTQGACLGGPMTKAYVENQNYIFVYENGDAIPDPPGPRWLIINVSCGCDLWKITDFEQPSTDNHPPNGPYVYTLYATSNLGCKHDCGLWDDCSSCAGRSPICQWCLESSDCVFREAPCKNTVRSPVFCPSPCSNASCTGCLANPRCGWCLGQGCTTINQICVNGQITSPQFCPKHSQN